jgi:squalene-hopene/tetraprenyl-beta-curcumene cyclase
MNLDQAIANTRAHLLSLRNAQGHWEGRLSSSALSTATAVVALSLVDAEQNESLIVRGAQWLIAHQNADGGWGDTTISKSNLSTTLLCWSSFKSAVGTRYAASETSGLGCNDANEQVSPSNANSSDAAQRVPTADLNDAVAKCETWIRAQVGSLEPDAICKAVIGRYGKDKTFSVPILMTCAIGGRLGDHDKAWRRVLALPFELAALPRAWFGAVGLPVVSYALPALIAIGHARFHHAPPAWWNPLRWLRGSLWPRIRPMLKALQPSTGGYLEATPLTSFVTMALACAGEKDNPCVPDAVRFLAASQREDGSWPIDTNLATWATTLSVKALGDDLPNEARTEVKAWILNQQYKAIHPFTNAAPGGWAWTNLPGGVPDADDTSGALVALWHLCDSEDERHELLPVVEAGITWLIDLQNRDGGMPTFCRGWGTLPFDRSTPEITAHAIAAWMTWREMLPENPALRMRIYNASRRACTYLSRTLERFLQQGDIPGDHLGLSDAAHRRWENKGLVDIGWNPLWFGNEHAPEETNLVFGTAQVINHVLATGAVSHDRQDNSMSTNGVYGELSIQFQPMIFMATDVLLACQNPDGGWGGGLGVVSSIEETAVTVEALSRMLRCHPKWKPIEDRHQGPRVFTAIQRGAAWLVEQTENGTHFPAAPIGLYFAKLWYHEEMYPVVWTLGALKQAAVALAESSSDPP